MDKCEKMMKKGSLSFYMAFSQLSSPRREAVYVIYAFCRMIDDSVDEPERSPYTLEELEQHFNHLETAEGHFIWPALRWLFGSFPLSKKPFYKQMTGQKSDMAFTSYETMRQLELYCDRVAGSVGEMLLPVLHDHPNHKIEEAGIYLGKAMQIVNIIRDVGEDLKRRRRYIPTEFMEKYGYTEKQLEAHVNNEAFREMTDGLMELAGRWFSKGLENIETYPKESAFSIRLASGFYAAIMEAVIGNGYDVFTNRAVVSDREKYEIWQAALENKSAQVGC